METKTMITTLSELEIGKKAKIIGMKGLGKIYRRIVEMGLTTGSVVQVERVAPLGDPIEIRVKGYHLSLRKDEAKGITVELESTAV